MAAPRACLDIAGQSAAAQSCCRSVAEMNHEQDNSGGFTPANWLAIIGLVVAGMVGYSALAADNSSNKTKLDQHADQIKALTSDNKRILDLLTELRVDVRYLRQAADKPQ